MGAISDTGAVVPSRLSDFDTRVASSRPCGTIPIASPSPGGRPFGRGSLPDAFPCRACRQASLPGHVAYLTLSVSNLVCTRCDNARGAPRVLEYSRILRAQRQRADRFALNLAMAATSFGGYFFLRGTFLPFLRALESAMAIACLRLFTLPPFPPLPLFAFPRL